MDVILSAIFIIAIPVAFCMGIAYFMALKDYKEMVVREMPEVWAAARSRARPLESWAPTAYKFLQGKYASIEDQARYPLVIAARRKAKLFLYISICSFMLILMSGLILDSIGS